MTERLRPTVDEAWGILFAEHSIPERIRGEGVFYIDARELNRYHEARLMAKFDTSATLPAPFREHGLSILPVGRGRYALGRFDAYRRVDAPQGPPRPLPAAPGLATLAPEDLYSEAAAILYAWNSGLVAEVCGADAAFTVSGRMSSGSFSFGVGLLPEAGRGDAAGGGQRQGGSAGGGPLPGKGGIAGRRPAVLLRVENAQVEIDAGFETGDAFYVFEAKNVMAGEFLVRQLYYPYRLWSARIRKRVSPVLMILSNDVFSFYVYGFRDPARYDSIALERSLSFLLEEPGPLAELDRLSRLGVSPPPSGIPFPQADSLERVVDLLGVLRGGPLAPEEVTRRYGFDPRQTRYYLSSCVWLGLAEAGRGNTPAGGSAPDPGAGKGAGRKASWRLSGEGERAMSLAPGGKRLALAAAVLGRPVFNAVWRLAVDRGAVPDPETATAILARHDPSLSLSTAARRARTVRSWIGTVLGWAAR